jgi:hypothetical protein
MGKLGFRTDEQKGGGNGCAACGALLARHRTVACEPAENRRARGVKVAAWPGG